MNYRIIITVTFFAGLILSAAPTLNAAEATAHITLEKRKSEKTDYYKIKKGDTLSGIITATFKPESKENRKQIYKVIRQLNPALTNIHKIYTGQKIVIPSKNEFPGLWATASTSTAESAEAPSRLPPTLISGYRMNVIRAVIERMGGTITTAGSYYIPLPEAGQITIDCAQTPVMELPDGSVILLDVSRMIPASVKRTLSSHWPDYKFVSISHQDDSPKILQAVLSASRAYSIKKTTNPLVIGRLPELRIAAGWLIDERLGSGKRKTNQLVTFIDDKRQALPQEIVDAAGINGLIITDVVIGHGVVAHPQMEHQIYSVVDLQRHAEMDLCEQLLHMLNLNPVRHQDMRIFEKNRDGFDLSIKTDLLVMHNNIKAVFNARPIPVEFKEALKNKDIETVILTPADSRLSIIQKTLFAAKIPFSTNIFSFPVTMQGGKARAVIRFPAVSTLLDGSHKYFIDFDMDASIYRFLHNRWGVKLIRF